jgi:hypothetical protein
MKFSPFFAVAEAMPGVSSDDVCATCGAGCLAGELLSCRRCPCAFHARCVGETALPSSLGSWLCNACRNANRQLDPVLGCEKGQSLCGALRRLAQEARFGNPLDLALHPSLHLSFVEENGCDWLRCVVCRSPRIVKPGVSSEACRYPFRCSLAFWLPSNERTCGGATSVERTIVSSLEGWIATRSRRRSILFSRYLDERSRENFGWPALDNSALAAAEEASAKFAVERERVRALCCNPIESRSMDVDLKLGLSKTRPPASLSNGYTLSLPGPSSAPNSRAVNPDRFACLEQVQNDSACKSADPEILRLSGLAAQMADALKPGDVNVSPAIRGNPVVIIPDDPAPMDTRAQSTPVESEATHGRAPIHSGMTSSGPSIANGVSAPLTLQTSAVNKQVATAQMLKRIAQLDFDHDVQDALVDLAMIPDYRLYIIFSAFKDRPNDLIRQVTRYARRSRTVLSMHETPIPVTGLSQTNMQFPQLAPQHQEQRSELNQVQQAMLLQQKQQLAQQQLQMRQQQREKFLQKDQQVEQRKQQQRRENLGRQQNNAIHPQRGHVYQLHQAQDQEAHLHGVNQGKADQLQVHMNGQHGISRSQVGYQEPYGRAALNSPPQFDDHFQQIQRTPNVPLLQIDAQRNPRHLQVQERQQNMLQIPPLSGMGLHEGIRHQQPDHTAQPNPGQVRDTGLQEMISQIQNNRFRASPSNTGQSHDVANVVASIMQRLQGRPQDPGAGS